jgi:hypothetical protein
MQNIIKDQRITPNYLRSIAKGRFKVNLSIRKEIIIIENLSHFQS